MKKKAVPRVEFLIFGLLPLLMVSEGFSYGGERFVLLRQPGRAGPTVVQMNQEIAALGGSVERTLRYHDGVVAELEPRALASLRSRLGGTIRIEEDYPAMIPAGETVEVASVSVQGQGQPAQTVPWGVAMIRAPQANEVTRGGGVLVCVVDTGIQPDHPDLADNIAGGESFVSDDSKDWGDDNGHGTHVAGTIAALDNGIGVVGVAPEAKLFSAKVLDSGGSGYSSWIAEGIRSCTAHHAQVINLSLVVSEDSQLIREAVFDAKKKGAVIIAASGNSGGEVFYPAKYPGVLAVSSIDSDMTFSSFSSWGPEIAFAAPGARVYSTMLYSDYALESGTSMAAPHVSGVAALMIAAKRNHLGARDVGMDSQRQGAGLIDALTSVTKKSTEAP